MQRVIILGCPGSGKTTFAQKLAYATSLQLVHLDYYYHDNNFHYESDKAGWRSRVSDLVKPNQWVIDGNYKSTLDIRLPRADTVIYFDYPRHITIMRMLKRRVRYHGKVRPDMPANWQEKITPEFYKFVLDFNSRVRPLMYDLLESHRRDKTIIIFRRPIDAQKYLENLR